MFREVNLLRTRDVTVEYSVMGTGEPILLFHGGHSNCHEEFGYTRLLEAGYSIITPSRAGYGQTSDITDLKKACCMYHNILDHLAVEKVHIIAVSAGGPTGIMFSAMFPDRVASLTLQCAVTKPWLTPQHREYKVAKLIFSPSSEKRTWKIVATLTNLLPKLTFRMMASSFSTLPYSEVKKRLDHGYIEQFRKMNNRQRSYSGFLIDLEQNQCEYFAQMRLIQAPTLIMHSNHDSSVPISHPQTARELIPHSEMCILDSWGHLIWIGKHAAEYDDALISFLTRSSSN
ncbi:alpha/beta hydrolase [Paenibacillus sp. FSL H7-0326]|uniref:alpha/beta fold hydrolase n=1 Tax=Paenibacillus sp. FSL H7-0326 TaxID=1921144 RepID=UPI0009701890|nr:alpha/beta hydrolase [Paenibacillus sp. FSL H7-0326]OMC70585.1 alpha/beta hydrolase [Paenibacillus sp. FSL H7-0326]